MARRDPPERRNRHPGPPTPEHMRRTRALKLRLPPEVDDQLRATAEREEMTPQSYVIRLLRQALQIV